MHSSDGTYKLEYSNNWATLMVHPPVGKGREVYVDDVLRRMKILGIPLVRNRVIREIIDEGAGKPVKLVKWPAGAKLSSRIEISVDAHWMSGFLTVSAPKKGGSFPSFESLLEALHEKGIYKGIDEEILSNIAEGKAYGKKVIIARGKSPVASKAMGVEYSFNIHAGKPYLQMEGGRINLKELNFIQNKKAGDLLAHVLPAVRGQVGYNIRGDILPPAAAGKPDILRRGANTCFNEEETKLFARIDGNARIRERRVIVEQVVVVDNVDYETGNLDFDGAVVVNGTVVGEFYVKAGGPVEIGKYVGRAYIRSAAGVLLRAGINGNGEGRIECDGDLYVRYIENAVIRCRGHLFVEEAVMNSSINVDGSIILTGKRSEIIGGEITAGGCIRCKKLGNVSGTKTKVSAGIRPGNIDNHKRLAALLEKRREELNRLDEQVQRLDTLKSRKDNPESKLLLLADKLSIKVKEVETDILRLREELSAAKEKLAVADGPLVVIEEEAYSGVTILMGAGERTIGAAGLRKTVLKLAGGSILEKAFNPDEPPDLGLRSI